MTSCRHWQRSVFNFNPYRVGEIEVSAATDQFSVQMNLGGKRCTGMMYGKPLKERKCNLQKMLGISYIFFVKTFKLGDG